MGKIWKVLLIATTTLFVAIIPTYAIASDGNDLQQQLDNVSSALAGDLSYLPTVRDYVTQAEGYVAYYQALVDANPTDRLNQIFLQDQISALATSRLSYSQITERIAAQTAQTNQLRLDVAAAQAAAAQAAATQAAAPGNELSESAIATQVTLAADRAEALRWEIQQDSYYNSVIPDQLAKLSSTLASLSPDSPNYKSFSEAKATLENTQLITMDRIAANKVLQVQQKTLVEKLTAIQQNTVQINAQDSKNVLVAALEIQQNLAQQAVDIAANISSISGSISNIDALLNRLTPSSAEYASLLATKTDLTNSLNAVNAADAVAKEKQAAQDVVDAAIRAETLPDRLEQALTGLSFVTSTTETTNTVPVLKQKRTTSGLYELKAKTVKESAEEADLTAVEKKEIIGVKFLIADNKKHTFKISNAKVDIDGNLVLSLPKALKSGDYKVKIAIPNEDQINIDVKVESK
jgi:hypothetical protein